MKLVPHMPQPAVRLLPVLVGMLCLAVAKSESSAPRAIFQPPVLEWPEGRSAAPASAEWRGQPGVKVTRRIGKLAEKCQLRRVREWASLRCVDVAVSAMTQLGGNNRGLSFHLDAPGDDRLPRGGVAVFPLRRNDKRAFMLWTLGPGYDGPLTVIPGVVVQAEWTGPNPVITLHDAVHEPVRTAQSERRRLEKP